MKSLVDQIVKFLVNAGSLALQWTRDHKKVAHGFVYVTLFSLIVVTMFNWFYTKNFSVLTGPRGASGVVYGEDLQKSFEDVSFGRIRIATEQTDGFGENLERISQDESGQVAGFAQLGFGDMSNVRVLLPLEQTYLYIVCSDSFFKHLVDTCTICNRKTEGPVIGPSTGSVAIPDPETVNVATAEKKPEVQKRSVGLYELLLAHKNLVDFGDPYGDSVEGEPSTAQSKTRQSKLRIALGPNRSGAHELAVEVLKHFGIDPSSDDKEQNRLYSFDESSSFAEAFNKLHNGDLDLVFHAGPLASDLVRQQQDYAFLVGLGDSADKIIKKSGKPILKGEFEKGLFGERIPGKRRIREECPLKLRNGHQVICMDKPGFSDDITVISTRRVLVCSKNMTKSNAYHLALGAQNALSERLGPINWPLRVEQESQAVGASGISIHEGAKLLRDGNSLSGLDRAFKAWNDSYLLICFALISYLVSLLSLIHI